jgi:sodium/hydrogen antiporter
MPTFSPELFIATLALIGVVIVTSALLSGVVERTGFPQVAVFLAIGAVLGTYGLGVMKVGIDSPILRVVATISLTLVLFTDAVSINISELRVHKLLGFLVLGPGTIASAAIIAVAAFWLFSIPLALAAMVGAALASTDPVLLRSLLRRPELSGSVRQALRIESGLNDAVLLPVVLVAIAAVSHTSHGAAGWPHLALSVLVLSPMAGAIVALAAIGSLELVRRRIGVRRDYESLYSLGVAFAAFAAAEAVHGSGFIAAFTAGLTIAAVDVELCDCFLEYGETTAEMALLFTFVLFGVSIIWTGLTTISGRTVLFACIALVARLVAFFPALLPAKISPKDRALIAWFGPRGLSTLLLILLPVFAGVPGSESLVAVCCLVVLASVFLHGLSPMVLFQKDTPSAAAPSSTGVAAPSAVPANSDGNVSMLRAATEPSGDAEFIDIPEIKALVDQGTPPIMLDSRSERSFNASEEALYDSVRIHPQHSVADATKLGIPFDTPLVVFCA